MITVFIILLLVMTFRGVGFVFSVFGKLMGVLFGILGYVLLGILGVTGFGLAVSFLPILILIGLVAIISKVITA